MIREAERKAKEMLDEANFQAERIKRKTEEELMVVYRVAYKQNLAEATYKSKKLIDKAKEKAEHEVKHIVSSFDRQIAEIEEKARENFDSAVDFIFNQFTS
jgi:vacuolar-type H+-ATPase subunit E/Vma4